LGGDEGIDAILEKNVRLGCNTCGTSPAPYLNPMDEYLRDVAYFAENFATTQGASDVLNGSGIKSKQKWHVEGAAFMLRVIREMQLKQTDIASFEYKYADNDEAVEPNEREVDIYTVKRKLIECKSWAANGASFQKFVLGKGNSYEQFKDYLSEIQDLDGLEYWFDKRKASEAEVKEKFRQLLYDEKTNTLTEKGKEVWKILEDKTPLLKKLGISPEESEEAQFTYIVGRLDEKFYKFIYAK
jgi:hypothetical protein